MRKVQSSLCDADNGLVVLLPPSWADFGLIGVAIIGLGVLRAGIGIRDGPAVPFRAAAASSRSIAVGVFDCPFVLDAEAGAGEDA